MADRKLTYLERWGRKRQAGWVYNVVMIAFRTFLALVFIQICVMMYNRNLVFKVEPVLIGIAVAAGLIYWFAHEFFYRRSQRRK